ncbi:MAG TPA: hypothetical protein VFL82_06055 [Thermomicrobiales bacterium]|nr:hypothetical protein [Thermomicrobiales bacterium]
MGRSVGRRPIFGLLTAFSLLIVLGMAAAGPVMVATTSAQAETDGVVAEASPMSEDGTVTEDPATGDDETPPVDTGGSTTEPGEVNSSMPSTGSASTEGEPVDEGATGNEDPSTAPPSEPASSPSLNIAPAAEPRCKPSGGAPEIVGQGGYLDYSCTYDVALTGAHLAPASIALAWTVDIAVDGGWQVQVKPRPAEVDANDPPRWTAEPAPTAMLQQQGPITPDASPDVADSLDLTATFPFKVRVYRVACGLEPRPVTLQLSVAATTPGIDGTVIEASGPDPQPFTLHPALAPIPEPSVAFSGPLDFGDVAVDATGVKTPPKPQMIIVTVSGLDKACGSWQLGLKATTLDGANNATIDAGNLHLSSINDRPVVNGSCPLDGGCPIAVIPAGSGVDPVATFNLGVSLVLPDQPRATTFNATLSAALTKAPS